MYICHVCGKSSLLKEKKNLVIVKTRHRQYVNENEINGKKVTVHSQGIETVKEIPVCKRCLK